MKRFVSMRLALLLTAPSMFGDVMLFPAPQPPGVIASPHYRLEVQNSPSTTVRGRRHRAAATREL